VTAFTVTPVHPVPTVVHLQTALSNVTAYPITRQNVVFVDLLTARARIGMQRVGPPNPLIMTVTPGAGTDDFGNAYQAGFHIYSGTTNGSRISLQSTNSTFGAQPTIEYIPASTSNITLSPQSFGFSNNGGASNQQTWLIHSSGKTNSKDDAAIQLLGQAADGSVAASIIMEFGGSVAFTVTKTLITSAIPFNSIPMVKNPASVLPDTNKGQLYVDNTGALIYFSPGGTATIVVSGP
jgi:hypothetical protein